MEQPVPANSSLLGKSPPSPGGTPSELTEAKKAIGNRRRTTSNTRHRYAANQLTTLTNTVLLTLKEYCHYAKSWICFPRRETVNEDNHRSQELLHFNSSTFGELVVHRGKSLGESCLTTQLVRCKSRAVRPSNLFCAFLSVFMILTGVSERLGRNVYYGFEANSGDFAVIYEWSLHWNRKMGKFFTSQEKGKIDNCKKQASKEGSSYYYFDFSG